MILKSLTLSWVDGVEPKSSYCKWLLIEAGDHVAVVIGMFVEHKDIPVPDGFRVLGAGDLDFDGYVNDWGSHGLKVETPHELRNDLQQLFLQNIEDIEQHWHL